MPLIFYKKNFRIYPTSTACSNSPDLNPVNNSMWEILQEIVYKTRINDLDLLTTLLTNGCCKINDDMI